MLWALMIYWIASTVFRSQPLFATALLAGILATGVEFLKLCHTPALDGFRRTLPGILLLGRFFSFWDVVAYWLAIFVGVVADRTMRLASGPNPR